MTSKRVGLLAMIAAAAVIWAIPAASAGKSVDLRETGQALRDVTAGVGAAVDKTLTKADAALDKANAALNKSAGGKADKRATTSEPRPSRRCTASGPHAQGGVAVVDLKPSNERPLGSKPDGSDAARTPSSAALGREGQRRLRRPHDDPRAARPGDRGVDTAEGETKNGPSATQAGILDPLCASTNEQVCLSVLTADSTTTAAGSDNNFAVARASVLGLGVGAAESHGTIGEDANCQAGQGASKVADVNAPGGGAVAAGVRFDDDVEVLPRRGARGHDDLARHRARRRAGADPGRRLRERHGRHRDRHPRRAADRLQRRGHRRRGRRARGARRLRPAGRLDLADEGDDGVVRGDQRGSARGEASGPQCSDTIDNDGDGVIDAADPGCHSDNDASNDASYNPNDDDETDKKSGGGTTGSGGETGVECADNKDNDGDGLIDEKDGGCHTDGNPNNPDSYDATDDSEATGGGTGDGGDGTAPTGGQSTSDDTLPFTGTDVVGLALAGLLMLAGGLLLRRREDGRTAF